MDVALAEKSRISSATTIVRDTLWKYPTKYNKEAKRNISHLVGDMHLFLYDKWPQQDIRSIDT